MSKESYNRKKLIKSLESEGWICWFPPKVKFQQSDVFGIIDVLALRRNKMKNIQLTTLSNVSARRKKITAFLTSNQVKLPVEIWAWHPKKKSFKKEKINIQLEKTPRKGA
ncbi:MAG: hypothetical protein Q8P63_02600 [Candidatus Nealsonbacteria bacterium]|nr:hypothetical protein [Candidatus Nealsonbacteria bacterium]